MRKEDAIEIFGSPVDLAKALGVTRQAIYQWPDKLGMDQADRVIGAAVRLGKIKTSENPKRSAA